MFSPPIVFVDQIQEKRPFYNEIIRRTSGHVNDLLSFILGPPFRKCLKKIEDKGYGADESKIMGIAGITLE